jgi:hypothetical protein
MGTTVRTDMLCITVNTNVRMLLDPRQELIVNLLK